MVQAVERPERSLGLYSLHTGERLRRVYWSEGRYLEDGLAEIGHLLRDHRTNEVHPIDPRLLDLLFALHREVNGREPFHVISGYRSPKTNAMLRRRSGGVAKKSLHMAGKAVDIRLPGRDLATLRRAALALEAGGVGHYPKVGFIHVDTGRVRAW
jgi:uncharacterized protein YcbK (DUF882 family)